MISIVCVYNDEEILRDYLFKDIKSQTMEFDIHIEEKFAFKREK